MAKVMTRRLRLNVLSVVACVLCCMTSVGAQDRIDASLPCQGPGVNSDGRRGRPEFTIDWYLCCQKYGKNSFEGCCMQCRCQWTLYYETAKKCFAAQTGNDDNKVFEDSVVRQKEEWEAINIEHCGKPPLESYSLDPTNIDYCAPAAFYSFRATWIVGLPLFMCTWLAVFDNNIIN